MSIDNLIKNTFAIFNSVSAVKIAYSEAVAQAGHLIKISDSFPVNNVSGQTIYADDCKLVIPSSWGNSTEVLHWEKNWLPIHKFKVYTQPHLRQIRDHFLQVIGEATIPTGQIVPITILFECIIDQVRAKIESVDGYELYADPRIFAELTQLRADLRRKNAAIQSSGFHSTSG